MALTDPIGDVLTMLKNAYSAGKDVVEVKNSRMHESIMRILKREKFISNYKLIRDNKQGILRIYLLYDKNGNPALMGIRRVSKPGRRVYKSKDEITPVYGGLGIEVLSTSKGVITDKEARELGVGGEAICQVW